MLKRRKRKQLKIILILRRLRTQSVAPTEEMIEEMRRKREEDGEQDKVQVAVAFGIFEDQVGELNIMILLGNNVFFS